MPDREQTGKRTPKAGGRGVRLWEALVLAALVGVASYAAGLRNGVKTEQRRIERSMSSDSPHGHGEGMGEGMGEAPAPSEAGGMPAMTKEALKEKLAGFSVEELLNIGNQHLDEARAVGDQDPEASHMRFLIAAAAYETALAQKPGDPNILMDLGLSLQGLGQTEEGEAHLREAVSGYQEALQARPQDPNLLTDQGISLRALGDSEGAVARFREAAKADPKHLQSRFNLGLVLSADLKHTDEAIAAWEEYLRLAPKDDEMRSTVEAEMKKLKG